VLLAALVGVVGRCRASDATRAAIVTPPAGGRDLERRQRQPHRGERTIELGGPRSPGPRPRRRLLRPGSHERQGQFTYLVDHTLLGRHVVAVTTTAGRSGNGPDRRAAAALLAAQSSIDVAYTVRT
jgi:hypothetical protein